MDVLDLFSFLSPAASEQVVSDEAPQVTLVSDGAFVEGTLRLSTGDLRIEGKIEGSVVTEGRVVVGKKAEVEGTISANTVRLAGDVVGEVHAEEKIVLSCSSKVHAILDADALEIQPGADFEGSVTGSVVGDGSTVELEGEPFSGPSPIGWTHLPRIPPFQNGSA